MIGLVLIESDWNLKCCQPLNGQSLYLVLIESDWNLKVKAGCVIDIIRKRINRIRLEFKVHSSLARHDRVSVLIESDWNLKQEVSSSLCIQVFVLIESDWNLKPYGYEKVNDEIGVLIESDWNLKVKNHSLLFREWLGINRIRLEFKGYSQTSLRANSLRY